MNLRFATKYIQSKATRKRGSLQVCFTEIRLHECANMHMTTRTPHVVFVIFIGIGRGEQGRAGAFSAKVPDSSFGGVPVVYCPDDDHMEEYVHLKVQAEEEK